MIPRADVLLVTVTKVESLAVIRAFRQRSRRQARLERRGEKVFHKLGILNQARVWLVRSEMGSGGLGGCQQTVTQAITELRPSAVIMVGIAFGVNSKRQRIGDILVSENLRLYELQRTGTGKDNKPQIVLRGSRPDSSRWLLDSFRNSDLQWRGAPVQFGCLLSGEKLIDNVDFRQQLLRFEPEAIGGEMEGAGLYTACQAAKVDWLLIKAICDWADGHKNRRKKSRQVKAAKNAAEFVLRTLSSITLRGNETSNSSKATSKSPNSTAHTPTEVVVLGAANMEILVRTYQDALAFEITRYLATVIREFDEKPRALDTAEVKECIWTIIDDERQKLQAFHFRGSNGSTPIMSLFEKFTRDRYDRLFDRDFEPILKSRQLDAFRRLQKVTELIRNIQRQVRNELLPIAQKEA